MPPISIRAPARMKYGMASSGSESTPTNIRCAITMGLMSPFNRTTTNADKPIARATGIPTTMRSVTSAKSVRMIMATAASSGA